MTWQRVEAELLKLGEWVNDHYQGDFLVDGRPITNVEMMADRIWHNRERERRIAEQGCCGEGHDVTGRCYGFGTCPQFLKQARSEEKHG